MALPSVLDGNVLRLGSARPYRSRLEGGGPPTTPESARFLFPDGLRGIAALMVVLYHLHQSLRPAVAAWFPSTLSAVFEHGYLGVPIFFVLSGFVIAHSVRNSELSWRFFGRFAFRRSVRLDPPLWTVIFLELALIQISVLAFPSLGAAMPSWRVVLANLTYTQHLVGSKDVVPVFWTLTYEVQFYLVLVGSLVALHQLGASRRMVSAAFATAFAYSLAIWGGSAPLPLPGLFIGRWFHFALGVAAWWLFAGRISWKPFAVLCAAVLLAALAAKGSDEHVITGIVTVMIGAALAAAGLANRMDRIFAGPILQFLGRISYSLYLIHDCVVWRLVALVKRLTGSLVFAPALGYATLVTGVLVSVLLAWLINVMVERPSMRIARQIRLPTCR